MELLRRAFIFTVVLLLVVVAGLSIALYLIQQHQGQIITAESHAVQRLEVTDRAALILAGQREVVAATLFEPFCEPARRIDPASASNDDPPMGELADSTRPLLSLKWVPPQAPAALPRRVNIECRLPQQVGHYCTPVHRPSEEWTIVENAHPALLTQEEATAIATARQRNATKRFDAHSRYRKTSEYLLSGGLFVCDRCGGNMMGYRTTSGTYYLCNSRPNRRGFGCGASVYVPQEEAEQQVIGGMLDFLGTCTDPKGFLRMFNEEVRALWEAANDYDPHAAAKLDEIERKINNIRQAIINGLDDAEWANREMQRLRTEKDALTRTLTLTGAPPQIDASEAKQYRQRVEAILQQGDAKTKRALVRECVEKVILYPDLLEVEVRYQLPAPIMQIGSGEQFSEAYRARDGSGGRRLGDREHVFAVLKAENLVLRSKYPPDSPFEHSPGHPATPARTSKTPQSRRFTSWYPNARMRPPR